jgi:hypothetical protein
LLGGDYESPQTGWPKNAGRINDLPDLVWYRLFDRGIEVQRTPITILSKDQDDYISLADMAMHFEGGSTLIEQWLKNKETVLFHGVWGQINNPDLIPPDSRDLEMKRGGTVSTSPRRSGLG